MATSDQIDVLWNAVQESYDADGLITLTNIRDRGANEISDSVGSNAAAGVIDLWPIYAQVDFDETDATHLEVAKRGVIAMLWTRGGTAATIAKVEWDEVFSTTGLIAQLRSAGPRGRPAPETNSGVQTSNETINGRAVLGWSDRRAMPNGMFPSRMPANGYD